MTKAEALDHLRARIAGAEHVGSYVTLDLDQARAIAAALNEAPSTAPEAR